MTNTSTNTATATTTAPTAPTAATVQAANAAHVYVWVMPTNPKTGLSAPRFATLTVGATVQAVRGMANGFTAGDMRWAAPRGQCLAVPAGGKVHTAWQAATAKGASAKVQAAFATAAQDALVAQAKAGGANPKQLANLPAITAAQPAGTTPKAAG